MNEHADNAFAFDRATGDDVRLDAMTSEEQAAAALARALATPESLPPALRAKLMMRASDFARGSGSGTPAPTRHEETPAPIAIATARRASPLPWLAAAAGLLLAAGTGYWAMRTLSHERSQLQLAEVELVTLRQRISENERIVTLAQSETEALRTELQGRGEELAQREAALASLTGEKRDVEQRLIQRERELLDKDGEVLAAKQEQTRLITQLASATSDLDRVQRELDQYVAPEDPAVLADRRTKLMEVPGTVRLGWAPFVAGTDPPAQEGVTGDVVWNDELQQGYLRFVGLDPNDPNIEQYQVWIVDERGMEQKVSGGVFDVTDAGEVIVPIKPGLDVRNVTLFAITVERPGGIVVPDLTKRVVLAPRGE